MNFEISGCPAGDYRIWGKAATRRIEVQDVSDLRRCLTDV